jgi:hypothetical protein
MRPETARRVAPLVVAALVLSVIAVVWVALRDDDPTGPGADGSSGSSGEATPLRLTGWSPPASGSPDPRYRLAPDADLPDGPGTAPVHRVRNASAADDAAARLARALGLPGGPVDGGAETVWQDEEQRLGVHHGAGSPWSYQRSFGAVTSGSGVSVDERVSSDERVWPDGGSDKEPVVATTSEEQARATARRFLDDAGLPDGAESVGPAGSRVEVQVDPEVDGLPTTGFGTTLVVAAGSVESGVGWLARTARGPAYPLVTAREAWDTLVRTPLPMPLVACAEPPPDAVDPVPCGGPVTVTGAHLGLSLQQTEDGPILLPSWLFTVEKSMHPLVQIAVQPRLLEPADGGGTGGGVPGSTGTAVPPESPSVAPGPEQPASRFSAVHRGADDRSIEVTFWGGVPECYDYAVKAVENDRTVSISVVESRPAGDKPCIDLAVEVNKTVRLDAPLALRQVVDAETGETLLGPAR